MSDERAESPRTISRDSLAGGTENQPDAWPRSSTYHRSASGGSPSSWVDSGDGEKPRRRTDSLVQDFGPSSLAADIEHSISQPLLRNLERHGSSIMADGRDATTRRQSKSLHAVSGANVIETFRRNNQEKSKTAGSRWRQATAKLVESLLNQTEQHKEVKENDPENPWAKQRVQSTTSSIILPVPEPPRKSSSVLPRGLTNLLDWTGPKSERNLMSGRALPDLCPDGVFRIMDRLGPFAQSRGHWAVSNVTVRRTKKSRATMSLQTARERFGSIATNFLERSERSVGIPGPDVEEGVMQRLRSPRSRLNGDNDSRSRFYSDGEVDRLQRPRVRLDSDLTESGDGQPCLRRLASGEFVDDCTGEDVEALFMEDIYHAFLDAKWWKQLVLFAMAYIISFIIFAVMYLAADKPCGLNLQGHFLAAYMLSLETMLTIGYGVPDPYMKGCWQGAVILTLQGLTQLLLGACLIGVIFQGLSRPQSRACTIVFSDRAVINKIDGAHYFMFRICDLRVQHAIIEPHVRCYCVKRHFSRGWEMIPMRLEQPDDELGASLLLTLPCTIVHRIDRWSPLSPGRRDQEDGGRRGWGKQVSGLEPICSKSWPKPRQRQSGAEAGGQDTCLCPTCGESFQTVNMLRRHCAYNARSDQVSDMPVEFRHRELTDEDLRILGDHDPTRRELADYLDQDYLEVVVLVEGIEPTTSSTLQARHSYVVGPSTSGDFEWEADFEECCDVVPGYGSKGLVLDLSRFHTLKPRDSEDGYSDLEEGDEEGLEDDDEAGREHRRSCHLQRQGSLQRQRSTGFTRQASCSSQNGLLRRMSH